jgi:hypothetical protein
MKLYEVPNGTHVKILDACPQEIVFFERPDGSYSVCQDKDGQLVHAYISCEVEIVEGF